MSDSRTSEQFEFVRLNGQAVRVTSWRPGKEAGSWNLVTITRGSRDASLLDDLLGQGRLQLEAGGDEAVTVNVADIDRRTVGEGESGITRFSVVLIAVDAPGDSNAGVSTRSLEDRVTSLETEVSRLRLLIDDHINGERH